MGLRGVSATRMFLTVCLLWMSGCVTQKVYFDCGAMVDAADVQGLVLSPGFPYNYSSGTHCVWQFFIPAGHQLIMEMFDFDVFESPDSPTTSADTMDEVPTDDGAALSKNPAISQSIGNFFKDAQSARREEVKQVVVQEQSTKMEMAKVFNADKMLSDYPSAVLSSPRSSQPLYGNQYDDEKIKNSVSLQASRAASISTEYKVNDFTTSSQTSIEEVSTSTLPPLIDACPHDVLYISDLITFSSRFCGSKRPSSSQLVFGSEVDMMEVVMELITTTHWGRGFALLFQYQNQTHSTKMGQQKSASPSDGGAGALLGAVSGAVVFAVCLASILCVIFRTKLCVKEATSASSTSSEVPEGVLNSAADVSELQMVSCNRLEQQMGTVNDNNNTGSSVNAALDASEKAALEMFSSCLTELELGTDEVFVNVTAPASAKLPITAHTQRDRFLRHSDTGPGRLFDWSSADSALPTVTKSSFTGSANSTRPRAWSVRTFQDLIPPLPQLHKKWCSWNSTSPFTKLVDTGLSNTASDGGRAKILSDVPPQNHDECCQSDSFMSSASYPLTQPAQRQRRLNSGSNLRRTRFNPPCFGLLESSKPQGSTNVNGNSSSNQPSETTSTPSGQQQVLSGEDDHVTVPVFAISEEEDRQPLVSAELSLRLNEQKCDGPNMPLLMKSSVSTTQQTRGDGLNGGQSGMLALEIKGPLSC